MKTLDIDVQPDHLKSIAKARRPILAISELIWNSFDADSINVKVLLNKNQLGGLESIQIVDDGHAILFSEAEGHFGQLGGSWKSIPDIKSKEKGRFLHGKEGKGRFRALALGTRAEWKSVFEDNGRLKTFTIVIDESSINTVFISDLSDAAPGVQRGVTLTISNLKTDFNLETDKVFNDLTYLTSSYILQYPDVKLELAGKPIDPKAAIDHEENLELPDVITSTSKHKSSIQIIEWKQKEERALWICNGKGFPLTQIPPGIHAPGFEFTAYLKSDFFHELEVAGNLDLIEFDQASGLAIEAAKNTLREYFQRRDLERGQSIVENWKFENIYPYTAPTTSPREDAERKLFDLVAVTVSKQVPNLMTAKGKSGRLQLNLLKYAIENAPNDLARILTEVLELPQEKREELNLLLNKTSLSNIISTAKIVTDRVEFLQGLETIVYDLTWKKALLERTQLHQIISQNQWMFGEQYHLAVNEASLTEVLRKHLAGKDIVIDEPVLRSDDRSGRVDLMFSAVNKRANDLDREYLIVELKRPSVILSSEILNQIESYAGAVADDERFRNVPAKWVFWAISTDMDKDARRKAKQSNRPQGLVYDSADSGMKIQVWTKTWSELIHECKARMQFYSDSLKLVPTTDSSIEHLKQTYAKYLPELEGRATQAQPVNGKAAPAAPVQASVNQP